MSDISRVEKLQGVRLPIDDSWLVLAEELEYFDKVNVYTTKYKRKKFQAKKMNQNEKDKICFQLSHEQSDVENQAAEATQFFDKLVCIEKKSIGINDKWMLLAKEIKEIEGEEEELNVYTIKHKPKKTKACGKKMTKI
jgi:hypothetical protein